jgi:methylated-DNA-[protein]-cysteine S-methyltransferase
MRATRPLAYDAVIPAPFGALGLRTDDGCLTGIDFLPPCSPLSPPRAALAREAARQLADYFAAPDFPFDLPLRLDGTPYRRRVWSAIRAIPPGATHTYGDLAAALASAPRAVGQAVGDNPLPIVVPCHRVVGRQGLGGFAHASNGYTMDIKRWLLRHEGVLRG